MSKLGALVAIPLGLFAIKQLQKQFPDDPNSTPLISPTPTETPFYPDLILRDIEKPEVKSCAYGYHLENGICVKSKDIGL